MLSYAILTIVLKWIFKKKLMSFSSLPLFWWTCQPLNECNQSIWAPLLQGFTALSSDLARGWTKTAKLEKSKSNCRMNIHSLQDSKTHSILPFYVSSRKNHPGGLNTALPTLKFERNPTDTQAVSEGNCCFITIIAYQSISKTKNTKHSPAHNKKVDPKSDEVLKHAENTTLAQA